MQIIIIPEIRDTIQNAQAYQKPGRSQLEQEKTINEDENDNRAQNRSP